MQTAEHGSGYSFQLCGQTVVTGGTGTRVVLPRKATALLAYLLLEPGPHSRAQLSALLWPESDDAHASMSLRQALSKLREVLGESLVADRHAVSLEDSDLTLAASCDVQRFEALLSHDPAQACAVDVHRFLEQCAVDDAPDFVHWCDRTRARLVRMAVRALAQHADDLRVRRDWRGLLRTGERWLMIDPLSADAAVAAIEAAFMQRDSAQALMLRDAFLQRLDDAGMAASPSAVRVQTLMQRFEHVTGMSPTTGVPAVRHIVPPSGEVAADATFPVSLQEREAAWQQVLAEYVAVLERGATRWVTVSGGVGSGRSRFLQDAAVVFLQRGAVVMTAGAPSTLPTVAYGAIAQLLRSVMKEDALAGVDESHLRTVLPLVPELAHHLPGLRRDTPAPQADGAFPIRLQDALTHIIIALCEERPLVIGLDDAMWCDRQSADTLRAVSQRTASCGVLWLVTDADDALQERENPAWGELVHAGVRITMPPLSERAIEQLLVEMSGLDRGWPPLAQRIHDASHGVAGSVLTVLRLLAEQWGPACAAWQQRSVTDVPLPSLSPRVRTYIDSLDDVSRTVLLSLALVMEPGHPVPDAAWRTRPVLTPTQLSHMHGISRLRAAIVGERLVDARLAVEEDGGYRCLSPVIVEYMLRLGSPLVRDELRRLLPRLTR